MQIDEQQAGRGVPPESGMDRAMKWMRWWSHLSERAFRVPFTRIRFGWDPVLGLIPGLGDITTALFTLLLLITSLRLRIPGIIRARLILNALLDAVLGTIPFAGDIFDFVWKSNSRNLALLEQHARGDRQPSASDWIFVLAVLATAVAAVLLPLWILGSVLEKLETGFLGMRLFAAAPARP